MISVSYPWPVLRHLKDKHDQATHRPGGGKVTLGSWKDYGIDRNNAHLTSMISWKKIPEREFFKSRLGGVELMIADTIMMKDGNTISHTIHEDSLTRISLVRVHIAKQGTGLGKRYMNALKDYATAMDKTLRVDMVANQRFFRSIPWLTEINNMTFEYNPRSG
jgi:hypothetical protein